MPAKRITVRRAYYLSERVRKFTKFAGGFTRLVKEANVYDATVTNAKKGKCLNESNAVKLEMFLDEQKVKPLSSTYLNNND